MSKEVFFENLDLYVLKYFPTQCKNKRDVTKVHQAIFY